MTTNIALRKILDRKQWEMCNVLPVSTAAGFTIASSLLPDQLQFVLTSTTAGFIYDPKEDAWAALPATTAITGTFGAGTCSTYTVNGPSGTATAGSATTITTNLTLPSSLSGYTIRTVAGTGSGQEKVILYNTLGANSVITVADNWVVTPDATTQYVLLTGRFWAFVGGTGGNGMRYFDFATQTWSAALSTVGVAAAFSTDAKLRSTPGYIASFTTGTASSSTGTTLTHSGKTWDVNQWTNFQVRIVSGTGAGQTRTIVSNTNTTLTVATWTVNPDATSVYIIEGNDDYLYLIGHNSVTLYRYSISGNTWVTLAPVAARAGTAGAGCSFNWIRASSNVLWANESSIINGRRLYSFRGGASSAVDYYDIPSNTWVSNVGPPLATETLTTGSVHENAGNGILFMQKDITGRFFRYECATNTFSPWHTLMYPQGTAIVGDRMFTVDFVDGATKITWVYFIISAGTLMFRSMLI